MMRTHIKDESGEDHIVESCSLDITTGKFFVWSSCCVKVITMSPEEFAVSYSVRPDN
jgi:hypothetical protein